MRSRTRSKGKLSPLFYALILLLTLVLFQKSGVKLQQKILLTPDFSPALREYDYINIVKNLNNISQSGSSEVTCEIGAPKPQIHEAISS